MSKRVYISPSDQTENRYAWGNTNEHAQCQRIAEAEAAALRRSGVEVKLAAFGTTMAQRCAESDAWHADIHNCVHTNACNKQVMGTRLFCYTIPGKGYDACKAVFAELAPLSPGTSENIQANSRLYEVRTPAAPTVYCECEFHDTVEGAKWIVEHTTEIGEAIAKGLCKYLGVTFVPAQAEEKPAEDTKADTGDVLYRVQVGAFAVRANADRMLEKLKAAGFTGFVVKGKK
nr:MAG TPA: Cell wall hydrolase autolysin [Caudoviricetes sp.]